MVGLSTKGKYGIKAMFELACHYGEGPVAIRQIATRHAIPMPYLEQLLVRLKKAELVRSIRGPKGGYLLKQPADDIRIGDIVRALEGPIGLCDCDATDEACAIAEDCVTRFFWKRISRKIEELFDQTTLQELVSERAI
ncbi:MAG: Rrf2 family transcriptional regulator [Candidatus Latescibacterota bacterium]